MARISGRRDNGSLRRRAVARLGVAIVCVFALSALITACAEPVTSQQLTDSILRSDAVDDAISLTEAQADCMADELLNSGLGEETLLGLAEDFDNPSILVIDADDIGQAVDEAAIVCADSATE